MKFPHILSDEAEKEVYDLIDKYVQKLPRNSSGEIDFSHEVFNNSKVDALRHAYVSGIFTQEYGELIADIFGRLNELVPYLSQGRGSDAINMDLWNNQVGRKYGKKVKDKKELFEMLVEALNNGELIINLNDERKYQGAKLIERQSESLVVVLEESETGENLIFYDIKEKVAFEKKDFVKKIKQGLYPCYEIRIIDDKETPVSKRDDQDFNNLG